jgi:hypothetical protein
MPLDEESPDAAMYDRWDPTESSPLSTAEKGLGAPQPEADTAPRFDDRYKEPLTGLLFLGALKKNFTWLSHTFTIRTLTIGEYAEIGVVAARYRETDFAAKAYQAATVAACLISVDGKPLPVMPVTNGMDDTNLQAKFDYVLNRWFSPVTDVVFTEFLELESRLRELLDELGKPSG